MCVSGDCGLVPSAPSEGQASKRGDTCVTSPPSGEEKEKENEGSGWIGLAGRRDSPPQHDQRGSEISLKAKRQIALTLSARLCHTFAVATLNVQFVFVSLGEFWET